MTKTADPPLSDSTDGPTPIGVKLGSAWTVLVFPDEDGSLETVQTRSCLAVTTDPASDEERISIGDAAERASPERTEYVLRSGLPSNATQAARTEQFVDELCAAHDLPEDSVVVSAIPTVRDECGLANLTTVLERSDVGAALTRGFPESLCGSLPAVGDGLEALDQRFVSINLGATTLEACAYRRGEQHAPFVSSAATGNSVDEAMVDAVEAQTDGRVTLDLTTARAYKDEHADFDSFEPFTDTVQGPDGGTRQFTVEHGVMDPLEAYLDDVVDELTSGFFARLATCHMKSYQLALTRPLVVTGGMASIPGLTAALATRLGDELGRDVTAVTAPRPAVAAAEGAYRLAERLASIH